MFNDGIGDPLANMFNDGVGDPFAAFADSDETQREDFDETFQFFQL